jgi:MoaA/NifB/PqqE/SkfB family radical SAM enzyme
VARAPRVRAGQARPAGLTDRIASEAISRRLWFYSNYHCNLRCSYCLTESAPGVPRRELDARTIVERADEAADLGFTAFGVTGGEPFIRDDMPDLVGELGRRLPTVVLSNGTLFNERRLRALEPLADLPVHVQISLDHPDPVENDEMRGPENFRKVVDAIPRLVERGIGVRIATTLEDPEAVDPQERERLCELHRSLGVPDEDHVVRPIVHRGRAVANGLGLPAGFEQLEPELTLTADGAFYSPFGPTVRDGRLDTDLLVTRTIAPLRRPVEALQRIADQLPDGHDASIGIR